MNADQRIRQTIGELIVQVAILQADNDELKAKIVALETPAPTPAASKDSD